MDQGTLQSKKVLTPGVLSSFVVVAVAIHCGTDRSPQIRWQTHLYGSFPGHWLSSPKMLLVRWAVTVVVAAQTALIPSPQTPQTHAIAPILEIPVLQLNLPGH